MVDPCRHHEPAAEKLEPGAEQSTVALLCRRQDSVFNECVLCPSFMNDKDWTYGKPSGAPCELPTMATEGAAALESPVGIFRDHATASAWSWKASCRRLIRSNCIDTIWFKAYVA